MSELTKNEDQLVTIDVDGLDYPISFAPAKINFVGQKKLDEDISRVINAYAEFDGTQVTAEQIDQVKKERTHINKLAKALTENTNNIVELAGKEILDFEFKNKNTVKKLNSVSGKLKIGVDKFVEIQKNDKHRQNIKYISKELEKNGIPDDYLKKVEENYNQKWDNKTYSYKVFQTEVGTMINGFIEDQKKRTQEIAAVLDACDNAVSSLDSNYFVKRLDVVPLVEVLKEIRAHDKEVQIAVNHAWNKTNEVESPENAENKPQEHATTTKVKDKVVDKKTGEIIKTIPVKLEMSLTQSQLKAFIPVLRKFLDDNNIDQSAVSLKKKVIKNDSKSQKYSRN